jgi:hypothetical protein
MQVAVKPDRPCRPQRSIASLPGADHSPTRAQEHLVTRSRSRRSFGWRGRRRLGAGHGGGKAIATKIGKRPAPKRQSNRQRRQCLNVGDNIDDDRTLRLNRSGDRVAKLVWFFDADAERANLLGQTGEIDGAEGP